MPASPASLATTVLPLLPAPTTHLTPPDTLISHFPPGDILTPVHAHGRKKYKCYLYMRKLLVRITSTTAGKEEVYCTHCFSQPISGPGQGHWMFAEGNTTNTLMHGHMRDKHPLLPTDEEGEMKVLRRMFLAAVEGEEEEEGGEEEEEGGGEEEEDEEGVCSGKRKVRESGDEEPVIRRQRVVLESGKDQASAPETRIWRAVKQPETLLEEAEKLEIPIEDATEPATPPPPTQIQPPSLPSSSIPIQPRTQIQQRAFRRLLLEFVIDTGSPPEIVDNPKFRALLEYLNPEALAFLGEGRELAKVIEQYGRWIGPEGPVGGGEGGL